MSLGARESWPEAKRLFLMRHGETYEPSLETRMALPDEDPELPLTEQGRAQGAAVSQALASMGIHRAVSSPFRRSLETARLVVEPHGIGVAASSALAEIQLHPPPGGTLRDVARRYLALARELTRSSPSEIELDDGRTLAAVIEDALAAVRGTLAEDGERVLVVAHGGLNRFLLARWLGLAPDRFLALDQDFACLNVIDFVRGGRPWVRAVNVTLHDPLKERGSPS